MCPVDSVSQATCFFALTVTHCNPALGRRDVLSPWLLSCDSSNCRVSSCFQLLPVRQTRLFLTNMPLEWEETRSLSREIKEVMLSLMLWYAPQKVRMRFVCLRICAVVLALASVVHNYSGSLSSNFFLHFILWMSLNNSLLLFFCTLKKQYLILLFNVISALQWRVIQLLVCLFSVFN